MLVWLPPPENVMYIKFPKFPQEPMQAKAIENLDFSHNSEGRILCKVTNHTSMAR